MKIGQLVADAKAAGVTLFVRDGKLRSRGEKGALTPELERRIREHKDALIAWLGEASISDGAEDTIPPVPRDGPIQLSFAQQRLWFFEQMEPGTATYNVGYALRIAGALDVAALRRGFQTIVDRHESLRTHFEQRDGQPVQATHPHLALEIPLDDLSHLPAEARDAAMLDACRRERLTPFDLQRAPLLRVRVLRLAADEHVLALTMHHIVSDGWSQGVLTQEFIACYTAYARGETPVLAPLPIQYADYAHWQRQPAQAERVARQLDYWKKTLAGLPPVLELPTDRPRPAQQSYRGGRYSFKVPAETLRSFETLCRQRGATLFMGVLTVFNMLLYRYGGGSDIAIGTPVAGRRHPVLERLIGAFSNTVVMRSEVVGELNFYTLLERARDRSLEAFDNQDVPFEQLVEALRPERSLSHAPLVQVKLVMENAPSGGAADVQGLRLAPVQVERLHAMFDLLLSATPTQQGLNCHLEYASDLFDEASIARMATHFRRLMTAAMDAPERPLAALPMLEASESQALTAARSFEPATERTPIAVQTVHALVEHHARATPRRTALVHEGERLDYAEFNRRANRLARWLRAQGVGIGDRIGLCLERDFDLPIAILAAAKAGAAYVPIDPAFPDDHIAYLVDDAGISLTLTHRELHARLPARAGAVRLEALADVLAQGGDADAHEDADRNLDLPVPAQALVYIIYTSGSTGRPKGVCIPHAALCNYIHAMLARLGLEGDAQFATLATIAADLGNTSVFGALGGGYALRLLPQAASMDAGALARSLAAEPIDCLKIVPSHLSGLLAQADPAAILPRKALIFGGESLKRDLIQHVRAAMPSCRIHNHYGPTETTVGTTMMEIRLDALGEDAGVPIGMPLARTRAYVLDADLNLLPAGVPGELYIGGVGLAHGYWRRPDLSAEKFVPDPFSSIPGARLYATGDKVRWRADGAIAFLGRTDHQLNIRGFRVEPGSLRAVLLQHPQVRDAAVMPQHDPRGETCMAAYVVPTAPGALDEAGLLAHVRARLPDYMSPAGIVVLPELPVTLNGKLDTRALPPLDFAQAAGAGEDASTETEHTVVACWREVLGVERIARDDNFFAIGGHSLMAMLVIARLRQTFEVELTVQQMFEAPTPKGLAACIDGMRGSAAPAPVAASVRIEPRDRSRPCPLSASQQRLWFLSELEGPSATYNMPVALRIHGRLDVEALGDSLREIVARHEVLRTCYRATDGIVEQVLMPAESFGLTLAQLPNAPENQLANPFANPLDRDESAEKEHVLKAAVQRAASAPFDLSRDCMMRAVLWPLAEDEHVLVVVLHHIACDGWSLSILVNELVGLYSARVRGESKALPALTLQYADYAAWQRQRLDEGAQAAQLAYWRERLAGAPELLELPYERTRPASQDFRGADRAFELPAHTTAALSRLALERGVTLYMVLLAAFKVLLARQSGSRDILVGSPVAGRIAPELEPLIGFFVNTLVLRTDIDPNARFGRILDAVRSTALEAFEHQEVPYEKLVEALRPTRSLAYAPLVQTMFSLQKLPDRTLELPGLRLAPVELQNTVAKFDLSLILSESADGIRGALEYSTALFSTARIDRLLAQYRRLLEQIAARPDLALAEIDWLTEQDRVRMDAWNAEAHAEFEAEPVHVQVQRQAQRTPDALALVGAQGQLRYAELDAKAEALASRLRAAGAGGQRRVALCLERDIDFPVGMLAIFKADAVYVPLDPSSPQERIAALLDDAQPALVVTRRAWRDLFAGRRCLCIDDDERSDGQGHDTTAIETDTTDVVADQASLPAAPQRAAYMIYTSGSTGTPKGVLVPHGAIANLSHATQRRLSIGPGDRVLQFAAQGFDVSVWETTMALCWGATLYLAPREELLPGPDLHRYLQRHGITRLALTASSLAATPSHDLPALRTVISGGEVCPAELVRRWQPGREFHNVYGPTEAGICTSMDRCQADDGEPTIGTAFANVAVYVLDERLERVPIGAWGELCVGGAGLAHGYWRRPDATAAAFVPDPYSGQPGARLYRTGDRVRLREDGKIEYHSRTDEQIKLRGFRIEPGEIESRLLRDPAVAEAAVAVRAPTQGAQQLVAYLVPASDAPLNTEALRRELVDYLPGYMVPSAFVSIERMPRTANGKIDRAALPMPTAADFAGSAQSDRSATPPQTPTEHWLAAMWCGLLGLERIGREDDFFGLGGHSLLATQVVSRVAAEQAVELPVRALFASPTLAAFAGAIDAARDAARHAQDDEAQLIASLEAMSEEEALALLGDEAMAARLLGDETAGGDAGLLAAMDR